MKYLTENVRETLAAQYPGEDIFEYDGVIYHVEPTREAYEKLRDKIHKDWVVWEEEDSPQHWIIYDPKCFEVITFHKLNYLHCTDLYHVTTPVNLGCCAHMFRERVFPKGYWFPDSFSTEGILNMEYMFDGSMFNDDCNLGPNLDTSEARDVSHMFESCSFDKNFRFGSGFDTSKVITMAYMFTWARFSGSIDLGDKFNTKNVVNMFAMFRHCFATGNLCLGNNFDTSNVKYMDSIFGYIEVDGYVDLGDKFTIKNADIRTCLFKECDLRNGIKFGDALIENCKKFVNIFKNCRLPGDPHFVGEDASLRTLKYLKEHGGS